MSELTLSREAKNALHTMIHNTAGIEPKDIAQVLGVSHKTVLNYANPNMDQHLPTVKAIESMMARGVNGVDIVKALVRGGFPDVAESMFNMLKQRVSGDYLHPAAIIDENWHVISFVNALNDYHGPGTGYQISEERWEAIKNIPNAIGPDDFN